MQKYLISLIAGVLIIGGGLSANYFSGKNPENNAGTVDAGIQCAIKVMTFYYLDECGWCQKVKKEGTIERLEKLGVKVEKINAAKGPVRHQIQSVPTFVINEQVYTGYRTYEELKDLLSCSKTENQSSENQNQFQPIQLQSIFSSEFIGEKGEKVVLENEEIKLGASVFNDNKARFYNVKMSNDKTIYFFVVRDKNGIYRAAANACAVCFKTYKGFRQEGNEIVCNNCGNRYPIERIATEKGGCNPGPINQNLEIKNGEIIIKKADLEQVLDLF